MGVTVRSASQAVAAAGSTPWTVPAPAGVTAGDLLVAFTTASGSSYTGLTASEFTQTGADGPGGGGESPCRVWLRVAGGSEPGSYTFGRPTSTVALGEIVALVGADTASPVDAALSWGSGAAAASQVAPSISPSLAGSMMVCGWRAGSFGTTNSYTVPGSMTERADQPSGNHYQALATELLAAAGATGTRTATGTGTPLLAWTAFSIAIKEAPLSTGTAQFMPFFT